MSLTASSTTTVAEYLSHERSSAVRSEWIDGQTVAMSGGSRAHNLIVTNLVRELSNRLKGGSCEVYSNDLRVGIPQGGLYTYPDVVVVCDPPRFEDDQVDTLLNPDLIFEVLSPSTESYDRGKKFERYRALDSLGNYLLVAQDRPRVERFQRQPGGFWLFSERMGLDQRLELERPELSIPLAEIYDRVAV